MIHSVPGATHSEHLPLLDPPEHGNAIFGQNQVLHQELPQRGSFHETHSHRGPGGPMHQYMPVHEGPPESLDALANATYDEAERLLHCNASDLEHFFEQKGVPSIGKALAHNGVTGTSVHMLSNVNIEQHLGLGLGQQLALKNFVRQLQAVSHTRKKVEVVLKWEEASDEEEEVWQEGSCPCAGCCGSCLCGEKPRAKGKKTAKGGKHKLKKASYALTTSELSMETWSWVTNEKKESALEKALCCSCCWPKKISATPQQCTHTNNIDLNCIEDVDYSMYTPTMVEYAPSCKEACCGYMALRRNPAATIELTYLERGSVDAPRRKQCEMKVKPEMVKEITHRILAEKEGAQAPHQETMLGGNSAAGTK